MVRDCWLPVLVVATTTWPLVWENQHMSEPDVGTMVRTSSGAHRAKA
jgi:hypothetical protein